METTRDFWQRVAELKGAAALLFLAAWSVWTGQAEVYGTAADLARSFLEEPSEDPALLAFLRGHFAARRLTAEELLLLPAGSVVRMTKRSRVRGEVVGVSETAHVTWREKLEDGTAYFGFHPCSRPDSVRCAWGCSKLGEAKPFGLLSVEVVHVAV